MDNPFLKRLMKDKTEDVIHSSAYGKVQNDNGIGTASTESFSVRQKIEKNRTNVRGYRDSGIIGGIRKNVVKAKTYEKSEDKFLNRGSKTGGESSKSLERAGFTDNNTVLRSSMKFSDSGSSSSSSKMSQPPARKNPGISR